jgi:hypothetical protein
MKSKLFFAMVAGFADIVLAKTPYKAPITLPSEEKLLEQMSVDKGGFSIWHMLFLAALVFLAWKYRALIKDFAIKIIDKLKNQKIMHTTTTKKHQNHEAKNEIKAEENNISALKTIISFAPVRKSKLLLILALICNVMIVGTGYFFLGKENRVKAIVLTVLGIFLIGIKWGLLFIVLWIYAFAHIIRSLFAKAE